MKKDYNTYDYLSASVKSEIVDQMQMRYEDFGWELIERLPHSKYYDIEILTFRRDRKIKNKDKLQYLQVVMEHKINEIARLKKWQYLPTIISTSLLCILDFLLVFGGIAVILLLMNSIGYITGGILSGVGLVLSALTVIINKHLSFYDSLKYKALSLKLNSEIKQICEQVVDLTDEQDRTQSS